MGNRSGGRPLSVGRGTPGQLGLGLMWALVLVAAVYFIRRDAVPYSDYTANTYGRFWTLRYWLIPHILGAGPALLLGPLQFSSDIRRRWAVFHRAVGRVYVVGGLVAAVAAFRLALASRCQPCVPPLAILAVLWFATTATALWAARRRAFGLHRQFVIRSYVLMCAFVIIRLIDDIPLPLAIEDKHVRRSVFEWLCWVVPFVLTEVWLSWSPAIRDARKPPNDEMRTKPAQATELRR